MIMGTLRNYGGETVGTVVHKFEVAGLGKAPFRFDGFEVKTYQACHGAPVQPGASCDFCGTGIMNVFWIKGADGKRFKVGCDCVEKTGDRGLLKVINAKVAEHKRELAHARIERKVAEARLVLPTIADALRSQPHPYEWLAKKGCSKLDFVEWTLAHAGWSAQERAAKLILKEAAALAAATVPS